MRMTINHRNSSCQRHLLVRDAAAAAVAFEETTTGRQDKATEKEGGDRIAESGQASTTSLPSTADSDVADSKVNRRDQSWPFLGTAKSEKNLRRRGRQNENYCLGVNDDAANDRTASTRTLLYQLSCQTCLDRHKQNKGYMGVYVSNSVDYKDTLTGILRGHFSHVSKLVRDEKENSSSGPQSSRLERGFATSSFSSHMAAHCRGLEEEEEVVEWCMDNVRVEVQTLSVGSGGSRRSSVR